MIISQKIKHAYQRIICRRDYKDPQVGGLKFAGQNILEMKSVLRGQGEALILKTFKYRVQLDTPPDNRSFIDTYPIHNINDIFGSYDTECRLTWVRVQSENDICDFSIDQDKWYCCLLDLSSEKLPSGHSKWHEWHKKEEVRDPKYISIIEKFERETKKYLPKDLEQSLIELRNNPIVSSKLSKLKPMT
jgi:hypothetical protein